MSTDPLFMKVGNQYYWYYNDHLGTPQKLTTSSGAVVWKAKYTSFGKATVDPSSAVVNPLRLPGQYEDAETGLYYNRFRYYDAEIGMYLEVDPLRLSQLKIIIQRILGDIQRSSAGGLKGNLNQLIVAYYFYYHAIYSPQSQNFYAYVQNNPVNFIDPYGLFENPFPKLPSFVDAFPKSRFVAPAADIIVGGMEGGVSVVTGVAAGVSFLSGPEFWWITALTASVSLESGVDAYGRISGGIERIEEGAICQ
jgi:RHS repeat-associated protein